MMQDKMRAKAENKEENRQVNAAPFVVKSQMIARGSKTRNISKPAKRQFNGHEFDLILTTDNKSKAKREAKKYHKHGFHTRVVEVYTGTFSVYRRPKQLAKFPLA